VLRLDLHLGRPHHLLRCLHQPEPLHPGVGPGLDPPDVVGVGAHLDADHEQWERHRELADPVALAAIDELVDQVTGDRVDLRFELTDAAAPERVVEQLAHLPVLGVVAPGERACRYPALLLVQLEDLGPHPCRLAAAREALDVAQHHLHVLVAGDVVSVELVVEPHGSLLAQCGIGVIRAVVRGRVEEVDLLDRHRWIVR
jgi:hypothetical protein